MLGCSATTKHAKIRLHHSQTDIVVVPKYLAMNRRLPLIVANILRCVRSQETGSEVVLTQRSENRILLNDRYERMCLH